MKFRMREYDNGKRFKIEYKRKYWFWCNIDGGSDWDSCAFADRVAISVDKYKSDQFKRVYHSYDEAKEKYDLMIKYMIEYKIRKSAKVKYRDELDFDNQAQIFLNQL